MDIRAILRKEGLMPRNLSSVTVVSVCLIQNFLLGGLGMWLEKKQKNTLESSYKKRAICLPLHQNVQILVPNPSVGRHLGTRR